MMLVAPEQLRNVWPQCAGWIEAAIKEGPGDENVLDVLIAIARGHYLLWWEPQKFCGVVQIQNHPQLRVALVVYCGGVDLEAIRKGFEQGKLWAREHGIQAIRTHGREGWKRALGLKAVGVILQETL